MPVDKILTVIYVPIPVNGAFGAPLTNCAPSEMKGRKGQYSTLAEHVPAQHRDIDGLWSRRWFIDRARAFGPATVTMIEQLLDRHVIEAQGYLDCQNILSGLGKRNRARLEAACQELVNRNGHDAPMSSETKDFSSFGQVGPAISQP